MHGAIACSGLLWPKYPPQYWPTEVGTITSVVQVSKLAYKQCSPFHPRYLYYTAKTQYLKFETNIPIKKFLGLSLDFVFMCLWANYIFPGSVYLFCYRKICGPILGIYNSLIDSWMWCGNWDWGRAIPFLGIHKWYFCCSVPPWTA